jgi:GT2 family glycosyltransferase
MVEARADAAQPVARLCPWQRFDAAWYLSRHGEAGLEDAQAARAHYERTLAEKPVSPNVYFDESWYRRRYSDVARLITEGKFRSGFEHYQQVGYATHDPHWLFSEEFYRQLYADLDAENLRRNGLLNGYHHFLISGQLEGRVGSWFFNAVFYGEHGGEAKDPFGHFLRVGQGQGLRASLLFDEAWYRLVYAEVGQAIAAGEVSSGLHHYLTNPTPTEFDPNPVFSERYYLAANEEVAKAVAEGKFRNGYDHYVRIGRFEGRRPTEWFDLDAFARRPEVKKAVSERRQPSGFDCYLQFRKTEPSRVGHLDSYGYHTPSGGWFFCGWVERPWNEQERPLLVARFDRGEQQGAAKACFYPREDLAGQGVGLVLFLPGGGRAPGRLTELVITCGEFSVTCAARAAQQLHDLELASRLQAVLTVPGADRNRGPMLALLARRGFTGADTLPELKPRIFLEIDEVIRCPPDGLLLIGWLLARPAAVAAIRLRCGRQVAELKLDESIRVERPDVLRAIGAEHGFAELASGFVAYVGLAVAAGEAAYVEVETDLGELNYRPLPVPKREGMGAIRHLLSLFEPTPDTVGRSFGSVIDPALRRLGAAYAAETPRCTVACFASPPAEPRISLVVPLFRRIDYLESQMALFSAEANQGDLEILYVLDDPPQRRATERLARSVFARFGLPFQLLMPERNLGFGPASTLGLRFARGTYVCFLNSDVFPQQPGWAGRLADRLQADSGLGVVGPLLLFEDGAVQHQGIHYQPLAEQGGLLFPLHDRKGLRPQERSGLHECVAITAACMMLRRELALELGGFDPAYLVGDFEDVDLCQKIRQRGLRCAVDFDVRLWHLERRSQVGSVERWRSNLTLYNAWVHEQRWGAALRAEGVREPESEAVSYRSAAIPQVRTASAGAIGVG